MINNRRVTAFTPFGRELTVSILYHYMKRDHDRGILDEWQLWMNTDDSTVVVMNGEFHNVVGQLDDVLYAYKLERENDWIKVIERPLSVPLFRKQLNTGLFYFSSNNLVASAFFSKSRTMVAFCFRKRKKTKRIRLLASALDCIARTRTYKRY